MDNTDLPKVTFGFVNCNRLFYLKSSIESLLYSTRDYVNKEILVVDNASTEEGTEEYLDDLEKRGFSIFRNTKRDPINEYAKALNTIAENSTGEFICPLEGDTQFIIDSGWLHEYVSFYQKYMEITGCMNLDAQRNVRNKSSRFALVNDGENSKYPIIFEIDRNPVSGAGSVMYSKKVLDMLYPWEIQNDSHEGGGDSETKMLNKIKNIMMEKDLKLMCAVPIVPPSAGIHTDFRGTNARIRGHRRYGDYWPPKEDFRYYKIQEYETLVARRYENQGRPLSIEQCVEAAGDWKLPIDENGNWKKNPIRPDQAGPNDYVDLEVKSYKEQKEQDHISEWLSD